MNTLGERIRILRGSISQSLFSQKFGITQNTLSRYERDQRTPDAQFLADICTKMDVSADWLLTGRGEAHTSSAPTSTDLDDRQPSQAHAKCEGPLGSAFDAASLSRELERERAERREATATVLKLYQEKEGLLREKEALLRENAELKIQLARLESVGSAPSPKRSEPTALGVVLVDDPLQHTSPASRSRARQVEAGR